MTSSVAGGGAKEASRARVRCAWAKFRELANIKESFSQSKSIQGPGYESR